MAAVVRDCALLTHFDHHAGNIGDRDESATSCSDDKEEYLSFDFTWTETTENIVHGLVHLVNKLDHKTLVRQFKKILQTTNGTELRLLQATFPVIAREGSKISFRCSIATGFSEPEFETARQLLEHAFIFADHLYKATHELSFRTYQLECLAHLGELRLIKAMQRGSFEEYVHSSLFLATADRLAAASNTVSPVSLNKPIWEFYRFCILQNRFDELLAHYEQAIEHAADPTALIPNIESLGDLCVHCGQLDIACRFYRLALDASTGDYKPTALLGKFSEACALVMAASDSSTPERVCLPCAAASSSSTSGGRFRSPLWTDDLEVDRYILWLIRQLVRRICTALLDRDAVAVLRRSAPGPSALPWRPASDELQRTAEQWLVATAAAALGDVFGVDVPSFGCLGDVHAVVDTMTQPLDGATAARVAEFNTRLLRALLSKMLEECVQMLELLTPVARFGELPDFAAVGVGSLSRGEMCPHSDIEFAALVGANATTTQRTHLRQVFQLLQLKLIGLGETPLVILGTAALPCGLRVDTGCAPVAPDGSAWLLRTPAELAAEVASNGNGAAFLGVYNSLRNVRLIYGRGTAAARLVAEYRQRLRVAMGAVSTPGMATVSTYHAAALSTGSLQTAPTAPSAPMSTQRQSMVALSSQGLRVYQQRALELLRDDLADVSTTWNAASATWLHVKAHLVRPLVLWVERLVLFCLGPQCTAREDDTRPVQSESTYERLRALRAEAILPVSTVDRLVAALEWGFAMRMVLHLYYGEERDDIGLADVDHADMSIAGAPRVVVDKAVFDRFRYFYVTVVAPLRKLVQRFVDTAGDTTVLYAVADMRRAEWEWHFSELVSPTTTPVHSFGERMLQGTLTTDVRVCGVNFIDKLFALDARGFPTVRRTQPSTIGGFRWRPDPHHPGNELAVGLLGDVLFGGAMPFMDYIRIHHAGRDWFFMVSEAVAGAVPLGSVDEADMRRPHVDTARFSEQAVLAMLCNPEDGHPATFDAVAVTNSCQGNQRQLLALVPTQYEHAFMSPYVDGHMATTTGNALSPCRLRTIVFCMDPMLYPVDPVVARRLSTMSPAAVLSDWLALLESRVWGLVAMRTEQRIEFAEGTVTRLFHKMLALQYKLRANPGCSLLELLQTAEPVAAESYSAILAMGKRFSLNQRFESLCRGRDTPRPRSGNRGLVRGGSTGSVVAERADMPAKCREKFRRARSASNPVPSHGRWAAAPSRDDGDNAASDEHDGDIAPSQWQPQQPSSYSGSVVVPFGMSTRRHAPQILRETELAALVQSRADEALDALLRDGNAVPFRRLESTAFKEAVVERTTFAELSVSQQDLLLWAIEGAPVCRLCIRNSRVLDNRRLRRLLRACSGGPLAFLDISGCRNITKDVGKLVAYYCPNIRCVDITSTNIRTFTLLCQPRLHTVRGLDTVVRVVDMTGDVLFDTTGVHCEKLRHYLNSLGVRMAPDGRYFYVALPGQPADSANKFRQLQCLPVDEWRDRLAFVDLTEVMTSSPPTLCGHTGGVNFLCTTAGGLLSASVDDGTIRLWNTLIDNTAVCATECECHPSVIGSRLRLLECNVYSTSLAVLPGDENVVAFQSITNDKTSVQLWSVMQGKCLAILQHPDGVPLTQITSFQQHGDQQLIGVSHDGMLQIWNTEVGTCVQRWRAHKPGRLSTAIISLGGKRRYIVTASASSDTIKVWDTNGALVRAHRVSQRRGVSCMHTVCGSLVACTTSAGVEIVDALLSSPVASMSLPSDGSHAAVSDVLSMAALSDGASLVTGHANGEIHVWSLRGLDHSKWGHVSAWRTPRDQPVTALAVLDDGRLCSGGEDGIIRVWGQASHT